MHKIIHLNFNQLYLKIQATAALNFPTKYFTNLGTNGLFVNTSML